MQFVAEIMFENVVAHSKHKEVSFIHTGVHQFLHTLEIIEGHTVVQLVEALCYKPERRSRV
jgi:hypothetical protein